jgi:GrpB-like predicted nucleotidyltransferase (UPF0157 family)
MDEKNNIQFQIIGVQEVFTNDSETHDKLSNFLFCFMSRVKEIDYGGKVTRLIRYEKCLSNNETLEFIGIEVQSITSIPTGMIAWVLNNDYLSILTQENGVNKIVSEQDIKWRWVAQAYNNGYIRNVGDFYIKNEQNNALEQNDYCLITNAYYDFSRGFENGDRVEIQEYDSAWKEQYIELKHWSLTNFGSDIALQIEHIGSTAIPGMPSKPSIDVAVKVPSFAEARKRIIPLLNSEMWEYWWFSPGTDILFYKREKFMGKRTHYIHLAPDNHELWHRIAFRDYLKSHAEDAIRYANLKRNLAVSLGGNWMSYTKAKSDFVNEITEKALKE